jgi:uncharacterized caspase-like protein
MTSLCRLKLEPGTMTSALDRRSAAFVCLLMATLGYLLLALAPPTQSQTSVERRVALVIGNGSYVYSPTLKNAINDGRAMTRLLTQLGFEVFSGIDVNRDAMEDLIASFTEKVQNADVALTFYAGHGIQVDGRNYLLPVDAKLERRADVRRLIDAQWLVEEAGRAKRLALVILDACRDNPLAGLLQTKERSLGVGRGLTMIQHQPPNTLVAYATAADATAADGAGDNSPYTTALLQHLPTPGLEIGLTFRRVRDTVITRTDGRQQPFTYGSLGGEELYLVPKSVPVPPPVAVPSVDYDGRDRTAFDTVRDSSRAEDFAVFLRSYPESALAPFARSRLEELRTRQPQAALTPPTAPQPRVEPAPRVPIPVPVPSAVESPLPAQIEVALRLGRTDWVRLQQALTALGFNTGGSDGRPGPNTRRAIGNWQKSKDQEITGYLSPLQRDLVLAEAQPKLAALVPSPPSPSPPPAPPSPPQQRPAPEPAVGVYPEKAQPKPPALPDDSGAEAKDRHAGEVYKDCAECPEMVTVPAGNFLMGSPNDETGRSENEGPRRRVEIASPLAIGRFEVTFAEWDACVEDGGCNAYAPSDEGWGSRQPAGGECQLVRRGSLRRVAEPTHGPSVSHAERGRVGVRGARGQHHDLPHWRHHLDRRGELQRHHGPQQRRARRVPAGHHRGRLARVERLWSLRRSRQCGGVGGRLLALKLQPGPERWLGLDDGRELRGTYPPRRQLVRRCLEPARRRPPERTARYARQRRRLPCRARRDALGRPPLRWTRAQRTSSWMWLSRRFSAGKAVRESV